MDYFQKLIGDIECHSVEGIRECFENRMDPNSIFKGKPLLFELITGYGRGPTFSACVKVFIEFGLELADQALLAVLSNDSKLLESELNKNPASIHRKYSFACAFTQLKDASLLHICAEYNHLSCAELLVSYGVDVNEIAGVDVYGFGGQTPIFHTVNQHNNVNKEVMNFLITRSADLQITVSGLIWGKGYSWETFIPAVNPISYAMMGLLRQFQRSEEHIYDVVSILIESAYGIDYKPVNIPNAYLIN